MPLTIRPAVPADAPTIVEFNCRLAEESEGTSLDPGLIGPGVAAGLADPDKAGYFVACNGADIVGQLMLTREWSDWRNGWFWWVQSVYVRPESRREGVFRALYDQVIQAARNDPGVIGLRLYVEEANRVAQETYRRLGMSATGYRVLELYPL